MLFGCGGIVETQSYDAFVNLVSEIVVNNRPEAIIMIAKGPAATQQLRPQITHTLSEVCAVSHAQRWFEDDAPPYQNQISDDVLTEA